MHISVRCGHLSLYGISIDPVKDQSIIWTDSCAKGQQLFVCRGSAANLETWRNVTVYTNLIDLFGFKLSKLGFEMITGFRVSHVIDQYLWKACGGSE